MTEDPHYVIPPADVIWPCGNPGTAPWCNHPECAAAGPFRRVELTTTGAEALAAIFRAFPETEVIE